MKDKINWEKLKLEVSKQGIDEVKNEYAFITRMYEYIKRYDEKNELFYSVQEYLIGKETEFTAILSEDIRELNICYNSGAYKSTLIMAGSILEAVLLEWLSEEEEKDYLNGYCPYDLSQMIDRIADINRPDWMYEQKKAHEVRKKRNLVHAKLCLKNEEGINKETCEKVLSYLKVILNTRLVKINQRRRSINMPQYMINFDGIDIQIE